MPYIARIDNGDTILELRQGVLHDIAEADRGNWRLVTEVRPTIDTFNQIYTTPSFVVANDAVEMLWGVETLSEVWLKMRLKEYAANLRWQKQVSPLTLPNGTIIDASEASKAKLDQALTVLEKGWAESIDFKASNGWIVVDLASLTLVAQALVQREQALFSAEKALDIDIDSGVVTTTAQINGWTWP